MADDSSDRVAMWQTYVQSAENTSIRRESINRYMVLAHLAIFSAHFALPGELSTLVHVSIASAGIVAAILWVSLLVSHGEINRIKYRVIQQLEADLPCQPFTEEDKLSGIRSRRRIYPALAKSQMVVASMASLGHAAMTGLYLQAPTYSWFSAIFLSP